MSKRKLNGSVNHYDIDEDELSQDEVVATVCRPSMVRRRRNRNHNQAHIIYTPPSPQKRVVRPRWDDENFTSLQLVPEDAADTDHNAADAAESKKSRRNGRNAYFLTTVRSDRLCFTSTN